MIVCDICSTEMKNHREIKITIDGASQLPLGDICLDCKQILFDKINNILDILKTRFINEKAKQEALDRAIQTMSLKMKDNNNE